MEIPENLRKQLEGLPDQPGVYLFKSAGGEVLYVGKAGVISDRVPQHFQEARRDSRKRALVEATAEIDTIVLEDDKQALSVEYDLIKEYRPRYNIVYRDDKSHPYIKVTTDESYPRVTVTREHRRDEARYFGPYTDVTSMRETLSALRDIFPYRSCSLDIPPGGDPEEYDYCLDYEINRCEAPCVGFQTEEAYEEMIGKLCDFLRGNYSPVRKYLRAEMEKHSENRNFEAAAVYRDRLEALEKMKDRSSFVQSTRSADVLGFGRSDEVGTVVVLQIRENRIVNRLEFPGVAARVSPGEALQDFVVTYYPVATTVPRGILLPEELPDTELVLERLALESDRRVELRVPERGEKKSLVDSANRTARQAAKNESLSRRRREGDVLLSAREVLDLPAVPRVVEGFDISTLQGRRTVGSMVRFLNGEPEKNGYRRFKVSEPASDDDYAALEEVVERRYTRLLDEERDLPDLVFVDGGPGQLSAVRGVLEEYDVGVPVVSLAKEEETLFVNNSSTVHNLPGDSAVLRFFQRVRDEAHRFAVNYHRDRRQEGISSDLREIKGIGEERVKMLLETFGSPSRVRQASLEELTTLPGITEAIAREIKSRG